jgi:hypothetical protein
MISFYGLLDVIAGDFSKLAHPNRISAFRSTRRHISRTKYSGEQLREIRAEKGVGRGARGGKWHKVGGFHAVAGMRLYPALVDSIYIRVSPSRNYLEWERKPRRKPRGVAA